MHFWLNVKTLLSAYVKSYGRGGKITKNASVKPANFAYEWHAPHFERAITVYVLTFGMLANIFKHKFF